MTEEKARDRFRSWVRERIEGETAFKIPELVKEALAKFGGDAAFLTSYAKTTLYARMYDDVQAVVGEARRIVQFNDTYVSADSPSEAVEAASRAIWGRWEKCFEHVEGRHMRVLDMGAKDLMAAESQRYESAEAHARWARFFRELRSGLNKKGQKVRDRYTQDQLEAIWHDVNGDGKEEAA